ncbi:MAG TPA: amidohydrolase, partial [Thermoanaerobaculia bacterium]|nr:amidohydrolase [Thermoanaerobaculia bacterium]
MGTEGLMAARLRLCGRWAALALFSLAGCGGRGGVGSASPEPAADLAFRHGAVYTVDAGRTWAEAVAVRGGRIVYVGPDRGLEPFLGPRTETIDLAGRMLLPGFEDSHVHLLTGGLHQEDCNVSAATTPEQVLDEVRRYAAAHPQAPWIRGRGWQLPLFPQANPSRTLLDQAAPGRAIALTAADGHSVWLSSEALRLAGITRETPDPPRGRIERDATGAPSGTLREAASGLLSKVLPPRTAADDLAGLRRGLVEAARLGITSVQDASVDEAILDAYRELDRRGELTVRATAAARVDPEAGLAEVQRLVSLREKYRGRRLRVTTAKLFLDGVIEARTAALLAPYLGIAGGSRGTANWEPEPLNRLVAALDRAGFQIHVHAIGDRAVRLALDAFENAQATVGRRDSRHQIAHLELIDPQDVPRFAKLGVIANFQSLWAYRDAYITDLTEPVLGEARSRWLYPL